MCISWLYAERVTLMLAAASVASTGVGTLEVCSLLGATQMSLSQFQSMLLAVIVELAVAITLSIVACVIIRLLITNVMKVYFVSKAPAKYCSRCGYDCAFLHRVAARCPECGGSSFRYSCATSYTQSNGRTLHANAMAMCFATFALYVLLLWRCV